MMILWQTVHIIKSDRDIRLFTRVQVVRYRRVLPPFAVGLAFSLSCVEQRTRINVATATDSHVISTCAHAHSAVHVIDIVRRPPPRPPTWQVE